METIHAQYTAQFVKEHYYRNNHFIKYGPYDESKIADYIDVFELHVEVRQINTRTTQQLTELLHLIQLPHDVSEILDRLMEHSENSYIVGGAVRDMLLHRTVKDFDFVTDIHYDELQEIFSDCEFKELGKQFLVFNLVYNGVEYEIANFRKDGTYTDGRRPDAVQIGTLDDDAARRDFTVNAIYFNFNGLVCTRQSFEDIRSLTLRFIGNPKDRLAEDYLRGWRFYRLLHTKDLIPDAKSLRAVRSNFDKILTVSPQRIQNEVERIIFSEGT